MQKISESRIVSVVGTGIGYNTATINTIGHVENEKMKNSGQIDDYYFTISCKFQIHLSKSESCHINNFDLKYVTFPINLF